MLLKLTNNLTKKVYNFDNLDDKLTSRLFYTFDITLQDDMDDGEYTYQLFDDENIVASGLIQIGDYTQNNNTYTPTEQNGYIQYNSSK